MAFIVLDGPDFSGKTTIASKLTDWLNDTHKIKTILTRHPGSTPVGSQLRKIVKESKEKIDPQTEALILAADNSAFIEQILKPALEQKTWIVGDRNNFITSLAYQIANGCSHYNLCKIHDATSINPPLIDLLLIFRISNETRDKRIKSRNSQLDNFEARGDDFTNKIFSIYNNYIDSYYDIITKFIKFRNAKLNAHYIDANGSVDEVFEKCKELIEHTYNFFHDPMY